MTRFGTFKPYTDYDVHGHKIIYSAAIQLNEWLEAHPGVEIISWQATAVGDHSELYITIQYKEGD
jgi:hypothetical protein